MRRWLLMALLVACTNTDAAPGWHDLPVPTPADALAAWDGPTGPLCQPELVAVELVSLPEAQQRCAGSDRVAGCFLATLGLSKAIVATDAVEPPALIAAHELAHWLFFCSGRRLEQDAYPNDHDDPYFHDTIEAIRAQLLPSKTRSSSAWSANSSRVTESSLMDFSRRSAAATA